MFVSRSMTQKVITTGSEASVFDAYEKMSQNRIRHLPIIDADGRLIGIVTDRDIRSALPYSMIKDPARTAETEKVKDLKVKDIMTTDPKTIGPHHTIQDALVLIQELRVGALPVVDKEG